jgi:hypothetical protein
MEGNQEAQAETQVEVPAVPDVELAAKDEISEDLKKPMTKEDDDDEYDMDKYPVREIELQFCGMAEKIRFNPVVSLIGISILWGVSIWCMVDPEG